MFSTFFRFEVSYWLRGFMLWIFILVNALLILAAVSSDNVRIGGALENTHRNAPHVIQTFYATMGLVCCLMTAAFVNSAASRDFAYNTSGIVFSKPISKLSYLMGRFWGSTLIAVLPLLGVSIGILIGKGMPWVDAERWGAVNWGAHLWAILVFALPNTIFMSAIIFAIAVWTRSTIASFLGVIILLVGYSVAESLLGDLENLQLAKLADPFGIRTFSLETRYWTVAEKNSQYMTLTGMLLWNRVIWFSAGMLILAASCWRFSFVDRSSRLSRRPASLEPAVRAARTIPVASIHSGFGASLSQTMSQVRIDLFSTIRSTVFIVIVVFALVNTGAALLLSAGEGFGLSSLPVTYQMIDLIRGSMYLFLVAIITFFGGVLVWKEREAGLDEVFDALPHSTWIMYIGKTISLTLIVAILLTIGWFAGVATQAINGYTRFQSQLYLTELLGLDLFRMFCLIMLSMIAHIMAPNKYLGYFFFILLLITDTFVWFMLDVETRLVNFGSLPTYIYSDLYHFAPFRTSLLAFIAYWLLFSGLIGVVSILLWQRGRETRMGNRLKTAWARWKGPIRLTSFAICAAWLSSGAWAYYNTKILNTFRTADQQEQLQVDYEKTFKKDHDGANQPRVTTIRYNIDLEPEKRALVLKGEQTIQNKSTEPISRLYLNLADGYDTTVAIDRATLAEEFKPYNYQVYEFNPPLMPEESVNMTFTVSYAAKGFENNVQRTDIVQNGTFFNNQICPQIGYQPQLELQNRNDRKKHGLGEPTVMPELEPDNLAARGNTYISNSSDWVDVETVISTSLDQIAVAPGSLLKSWEENGKRYFHYKVDHPSLNFYSFISARYEVARDEWNGVQTEVYYHPEHKWNVSNMMRSIHKSLEYYTTNFGPYHHKQARIIEFPRVATFAQAFPGTMPYSEAIGFIADIKDEDDLDMVFYVVAHEMAHQWWAHQVIGANMQGATLLSETLAQYSALMVMEKEFGRDIMRRFLAYEMDSYLRSRGAELLKERPLRTVEANQGYIHYRKGSVVMYQLKELIGEDRINAALRSLVDRFAYRDSPYPTSIDLINALREQTPPEHQELLTELFDQITLYSNRTVSASYKPIEGGQFEVTLTAECHKFAADNQGNETEIDFQHDIEIGAFAKPEAGRKYGATLHRARVPMEEGMNTVTFTLDAIPDQVGIDPFLLLIDRVPADNLKRCELQTE